MMHTTKPFNLVIRYNNAWLAPRKDFQGCQGYQLIRLSDANDSLIDCYRALDILYCTMRLKANALWPLVPLALTLEKLDAVFQISISLD